MKINISREVSFKNMLPGTFFLYMNELYLKLEGRLCFASDEGDFGDVNAIHFPSADPAYFGDEDIVFPMVNTEINVRN